MNRYNLFIDELGIPDPKDKSSDIYVLTGIAVKEEFQNDLKIKADQIKFKYWNSTEIVFHSREIGKNIGNFNTLKKNPAKKISFLNDLFKYLSAVPVTIFTVIVDKKIARGKKWNHIKVIRESIRLLYFNYLTFLLGKTQSKGKIVVESASAEKDIYYLRYFAYFTSPNCKELGADYRVIQNILTSISFVTKRNFDIEEQIADLFSYAGKCKYRKDIKKQPISKNTYEDQIIKIFNSKLFLKPKILRASKIKFYERIESFVILPK